VAFEHVLWSDRDDAPVVMDTTKYPHMGLCISHMFSVVGLKSP
jgi:hypothetical protein